MSTIKKLLLPALFFLLSYGIRANNVTVSNVALRDQNPGGDYTHIEFDVSWENSWRITAAPANWDAVWIFAKFRPRIGGEWKHCSLNWVDGTGAADGHTVPSGAVISSAQDAAGISRGVFMYASGITGGNVNYTDARLRWNYGADGLGDADSVEISVFAIEMVYVPEGSFWVGTGNTGDFYKSPTVTDPYKIISEDTIRSGVNAGNLRWLSTTSQPTAIIPAAFPKGFRAFYCMKYELTQDMWVAFLNHIPAAYATTRHSGTTTASNRNAISVSAGVYSTTRPNVPISGINWEDMLIFLDWAALRPMTELEFEKACRGPVYPVASEYAWGTALVAGTAYIYSNNNNADEAIATNYSIAANTGNAITPNTVGSLGGPARSGIFAAHGSNNGRLTSGATYYGIMEMSGNTTEMVVSLATANGRIFDGLNGDGILSLSGTFNTANWGSSADYILRGGNLRSTAGLVSSRTFAVGTQVAGVTNKDYTHGIRGVRTAP
jgi:formylglycine-generating enzyme required for sulfatase activity